MEKEKITRRSLFSLAAAAGLLSGPILADNIFTPHSTRPKLAPRDLPKKGEKIHIFKIDLTLSVHEIVPGIKVHAFTYNGILPGPLIRVAEGDWVQVHFTNKGPDFHTIHWHGVMVPFEMDGVPFGSQWPVPPNQSFNYLFRAQPAGTHFYHCHNMTSLHIQAGMYGAFIIQPIDDPIVKTFPYKRDYTLILSEMDTNMVERQLAEMVQMSETMETMNQSPTLMKEMNGRMMGWFFDKKAFVDAVKNGYIPPYTKAKTGYVTAPNLNFFMINGKSFPMTEHLRIKKGELIRVRLINVGIIPHFMHLHGHDFWHVCQDGSPLANPLRLNTVPVFPGSSCDIIIEGTNPGHWHFHDHSDLSLTNNGISPGGMMTMLSYENAKVNFKEIIPINS
jgi:FtsP/CotA-like multicopper oxidase with cupredoxin domain